MCYSGYAAIDLSRKRYATAGCRGKDTKVVSEWGRWLHRLVRNVRAEVGSVVQEFAEWKIVVSLLAIIQLRRQPETERIAEIRDLGSVLATENADSPSYAVNCDRSQSEIRDMNIHNTEGLVGR